MRITRTGWEGPTVRIEADEGPLPWEADEPFHWQVGPLEAPPVTPRYVFEPRPVERIDADLEAATTEDARRLLEAERRLSDRPHVVYIAFHGTLPKVGMTSENRLMDRLREQGADAGFVVARTADRAAARATEQAVAFRHRIPEWRTHKEILPQWTRPVPHDRIASRADDLRRRLAPTYDAGPLQVIDDHPLPVLPARPHRVVAPGLHVGTIIGAKGNHLVYEPQKDPRRLAVGHARIAALPLRDLEGRSITVDAA